MPNYAQILIIKLNIMGLVTLNCLNCGKSFERRSEEHTRSLKLNRKEFCSSSCCASYSNRLKGIKAEGLDHYLEVYDVRTLQGLRLLYTETKKRGKYNDLSFDDIVITWEFQGGKCFYTDIPLILQTTSSEKVDHRFRASVDRFDSNIGYTVNNIQFTTTSINYMKNRLSHDETIELIEMIKRSGDC